jgi:hypothetical protein
VGRYTWPYGRPIRDSVLKRARSAWGVTQSGLGWVESPDRKKPEPAVVRFHTRVAVLIACVSMVGAVAAWRASIHADKASELDQQAIQEHTQKAELDLTFAALANEDVRQVTVYRSELAASITSAQEADAVRASNPGRAAELDAQALEELRQAETTRRFIVYIDESSASVAQIAPTPDLYVSWLQNSNSDYKKLQPEATHNLAQAEHLTAQWLIEIVGAFIAALVFLTLAQLSDTGKRRGFVAVGSLIALIGVGATLRVDRDAITYGAVAVVGLAYAIAYVLVGRSRPETS